MAQYARRGVHGQTVEVIARRILAGEIAAGETLNMTALQEELDVSLTALREALKVLSAKGMVDARQKRGTFVRPRADWNLLDGDVIRWQFAEGADPRLFDKLHEVRSIVEPAAARLAASRATEADLAALAGALDEMAAANGDPAAAVAADLSFHRALLNATHNELLERMEVVMETGLAERDRLVHGGVEPHDDPVPSHLAVVEAIRAQNATAAETAMRVLLEKAVRDVEKVRG
ncbi:FadR/GntR family transcriptional regulator [Planotetraspora phitsanulokensis]|uniref:GntR family transcriptional regulator n=1 Tax=Planotetraspora phitsanulokensis TaxID=575192 RepID=A0A8J3U8Y4_9ACTN|nr:FCD domain-containing protein [Planotetraspora phitsanulokensis]GII40322.1 GntR family transcriptional regulator [Planotetraspora phitsanulokensis]